MKTNRIIDTAFTAILLITKGLHSTKDRILASYDGWIAFKVEGKPRYQRKYITIVSNEDMWLPFVTTNVNINPVPSMMGPDLDTVIKNVDEFFFEDQ